MHDMSSNRLLSRSTLSPLLVALMLGFTGCAAMQPQATKGGSVMADADSGTALDANMNGFLSQSAPVATVTLTNSPWGADVEVMANAPYYAASGRTCRQLQVTQLQNRNVRFEVACQQASGSWVSQRLVTPPRAGRIGR